MAKKGKHEEKKNESFLITAKNELDIGKKGLTAQRNWISFNNSTKGPGHDKEGKSE